MQRVQIFGGDFGDGRVEFSFCFLSGAKACRNLQVPSKARVSARDIQQHLRANCERDDLHAIDWCSKLVLPGEPFRELDFTHDNDILGLVEVRRILASTPGVVSLHVIREPLWNCLI